ncbi:MAG: DHH family phosphoesterase [Lachnospiraceae bacterium]|jgi:nanoRNase/pAp phosphatase (c-di-AMP/oligoRNAs hydrolase)|nr:DHH family phosphoesterase [Lachnospiraceae bacterium]
MSDFPDLVELCKGHNIYIQTHNFPDPDAIASAYGLQKLLLFYEIPSTLCYDGRIDKLSASKMLEVFQIQMLSYESLLPDMQKDDYIICVDSQKHSGNVTDFVGDEVACIDHHPTFVQMDYRYQDIRITGACATLIAEYYKKAGKEPDRDTATALLYGLKMDTLQFTRGVTGADIKMFEFLFQYCDQEKLADLERNNMEFDDLKAYGAAIESIELYDKTGFSCIPFSCPDALIAILSDFILALIEVEVAVVFSYREDGIKLSVRSEDPKIHAGDMIHDALLGIGNGGGHASMAGGLIKKENVGALGRYPKDAVRNLFLKVLEGKEAVHVE